MRLATALFVAFLCVAPSELIARDIKVLGGEHESFTRLVLYTQHSDEKNLEHKGDLLLFETDRSINFDISRTLERIDDTRVASVLPVGEGVLEIRLNCECDPLTMELADGEFVIDIVDTTARTNEAEHAKNIHGQGIKIPISEPHEARLGLPILVAIESHRIAATSHDEEPSSSEIRSRDRSAEALISEDALLKQLARAASQGLLETRDPIHAEINKSNSSEDSQELESVAPPVKAVVFGQNNQVSVQTVVDRDHQLTRSEDALMVTGNACADTRDFDIAAWGGNTTQTVDFGAYRAGVFGEFDRLDAENFERLIKHQIYLSLGFEALADLTAVDHDLESTAILQAMAEIMDLGYATHADAFLSQMNCDANVALWAVLAQPNLMKENAINKNAILKTFSALPIHLKTHLGPMLIQKLTGADHSGTAFEINQIVQRSHRAFSAPVQLGDVQVRLEGPEAPEAAHDLTEIAQQNHLHAAKAMLLLIEKHIQKDEGIAEKTLQSLASLVYEHQGTKTGIELEHSEIRALFHIGQFRQAFNKLERLTARDGISENLVQKVLAEAANLLAKNASESVFLHHALTKNIWLGVQEETLIPLAKRLVKLGFPKEAKSLLLSIDHAPGKDARRVIANAYILENKPGVAIGYLTGLDDMHSKKLKAEALSMSGQHKDAAAILIELGQSGDAQNELWRSGERSQDIVLNNEALAAASTLVSSKDTTNIPETPGTLVPFGVLLEESQNTRSVLSDLLKEFPAPES